MKLSAVVKERWGNIYYKEFFPVATNYGTYGTCASSLSKSVNPFLLGVIKHRAPLSIIISIEQESEIIISHKSKSNKWGVTFFPNSWHGKFWSLRMRALRFLNQY